MMTRLVSDEDAAHMQPDMSVDIYVSPKFLLGRHPSLATAEFRLAISDAMDYHSISKTLAEGAEWRIKPLAKAPPCEACEWCTDDI